jgi:uncharacterized membrane protein YeaQ/YmgE (transglycosylase-associated protein family)
MPALQPLLWLLLGLASGAVAALLAHEHSARGWLLDAMVGVLGAFVGAFLARAVLVAESASPFGVASAALAGAIVALAVERLWSDARHRERYVT